MPVLNKKTESATNATYESKVDILRQYKKKSQFMEIARRFMKNKAAVAGLIFMILLILVMIFDDVIVSYDKALNQVISERLQPPSAKHIFGTDQFGRDIFARVIHGAKWSILVSMTAVIASLILGSILASIGVYYGGVVDAVIMRVMDILYSIPYMLLALTLVAALGASFVNVMIACAISATPGFCRVVRAEMLGVMSNDFIEAAKACNVAPRYIMFQHIFPNAIGTVIVQATMQIAHIILVAAGMSYLGMGVQPPTPEWGAMLSEGRPYMSDAMYMMVFPGLAIVLASLSLNLIGDGLRDSLDPKLKN